MNSKKSECRGSPLNAKTVIALAAQARRAGKPSMDGNEGDARFSYGAHQGAALLSSEDLELIGSLGSEFDEMKELRAMDDRATGTMEFAALDGAALLRDRKRRRVRQALADLAFEAAASNRASRLDSSPVEDDTWRRLGDDALFESAVSRAGSMGAVSTTLSGTPGSTCCACGTHCVEPFSCSGERVRCSACVSGRLFCLDCREAGSRWVEAAREPGRRSKGETGKATDNLSDYAGESAPSTRSGLGDSERRASEFAAAPFEDDLASPSAMRWWAAIAVGLLLIALALGLGWASAAWYPRIGAIGALG